MGYDDFEDVMKHAYYYTRDTDTNFILWSRFPGREDVVWGAVETEEDAIENCAFMARRFS